MRVKCFAQEHNAVPRPRLEPGPLDPEFSALIIWPQRLLKGQWTWPIIAWLESFVPYFEDNMYFKFFYLYQNLEDIDQVQLGMHY